MTTTDPHYHRQETSIAELAKGLIKDVSALFRQEIELAKTEAGERMESAVNGGRMIVIGAIFAIGALGVLLAGIVVGVTAWLVSLGMDPMIANMVAAIGVAVVVGAIGWAMISGGMKKLKMSNFRLDRTTHSLSEDAAAVKERFQ